MFIIHKEYIFTNSRHTAQPLRQQENKFPY